MNVKEKVSNHVSRMTELFDSGEIENLRTNDITELSKHYNVLQCSFPFGQRVVLQKKNSTKYIDLQSARGGSVTLDNTLSFDNQIKDLESDIAEIKKSDILRAEELKFYLDNINGDLDIKKFKDIRKIAELGFRTPKLLKYYSDQKIDSTGYDVIDINIETARYLGYKAKKYDFNLCSSATCKCEICCAELDLKDFDVVVSYHMLEHTTFPHMAVSRIFNAMRGGGVFHVEIPLENLKDKKETEQLPNIRYGHMFCFFPEDMKWMLEKAGFYVANYSKISHSMIGSEERYIAIKPGRSVK